MKKAVIALVLLISFTTIFSQKSGHDFKIRIKGSTDTIMFLVNYYADQQYIRDTATIDQNGFARFKADTLLPGGIYLGVNQERKYFEFILDKDQQFSLETEGDDFVKNMKVSGSEDNKLFYEYLNYVSEKGREAEKWTNIRKKITPENQDSLDLVDKKIKKINKEVIGYKMDYVKKHPDDFLSKVFLASKEPEIDEDDPRLKEDSTFGYRYYKSHYFEGFDFSDDRLLRTPVFAQKVKTYWTKILLQHPDTLIKEADWMIAQTKGNKETFKFIVWYTTYSSETAKIMGLDAVFVHLVEKYYMTDQAYWISEKTKEKITKAAMNKKRTLIGKVAPDLIMTDSLGHFVQLSKIQSPYTILYFWDTDCGHCKKETPKLWKFYQDYKDKGVIVYAVSTDPDYKRWTKYVRDKGWNWINVFDSRNWTNYHQIYDVIATPVLFVLDKDKKIIAKKIAVDQLSDFMDRTMEKEKEDK